MPYRLERSLFIPRSREDVFQFFSDACNLERITPAFLRFHILTPGPVSMQPGTLIDYELRLYGLPFRWRTLIQAFESPNYFIDVQIKGPYKKWHHRHQFEDVPGGTQMYDRVDYDLPFGPIGAATHMLFVRRSVEEIFDYRNEAIMRIFQNGE